MKTIFLIITSACIVEQLLAAPVKSSRDILLVPTRILYNNNIPLAQTRGPFDFLGNFIQSSEWFPIEINIPDTFSTIGNGVGSFATNVGSNVNNFAQGVGTGFQTFSQNVGSGFQNFAQNLSQRVPILGAIIRPIRGRPEKYFILIPSQSQKASGENDIPNNVPYVQMMDNEVLESFP